MPASKLLILNCDDVRQSLPMKDAVAAMKDAFLELSEGRCVEPARTHVEIPDRGGDVLFMPSYNSDSGLIGLKTVTLFDGNHKVGLPHIQAVVVLLDAANGSPVAVLDGTSLTGIRTGAASGAATDLLARQDARTVAIFGAGVQGRSHTAAVCAVRPIEKAQVFDLDRDRAAAMALEMEAEHGISMRAAATAEEALDGADIVCTTTTSENPVFDDRWIAPGTHINAVGSYQPHVREIPPDTVLRARVVVDQREAAWLEAGELISMRDKGLIGEDHIWAELGEVVNGSRPGREDDRQITLFKSVGIAVQDLIAGSRVLARARECGLGTELPLGA